MPQPNDLVPCPSCNVNVKYALLNSHLDKCLTGQLINSTTGSHERSAADDAPSEKGVFASMMTGVKKRKASSAFAEASQDGNLSSPGRVQHDVQEIGKDRQIPTSVTGKSEADASIETENEGRKVLARTPPPPSPARARPPAPSSSKRRLDDSTPLAERLRPRNLSEFVGQDELVKRGPLAALLRQGRLPSCIFWGPPGVGKTTLARLLTKAANDTLQARQATAETNAAMYRFVEVSATTAGTSDVKRIFDESISRLHLTGQKTVLFIDEVQRFSRSQQDVFLPVVERGQIILIAATTENPSFRLQSALLSRMRVFVLDKLSVESCLQILKGARSRAKEFGYGDSREAKRDGETDTTTNHRSFHQHQRTEPVSDAILDFIAQSCDGDARSALQSLEIALLAADPALTDEENLASLKTALKRQALLYDRTGDQHYDTISALHKSIRGSNPDAALYWLARMVSAGDDPLFIARRLIVAASEDCDGNIEALQMAVATYQACQVVGLPECGENLAQCVVLLSESPKSTRSYKAWKKALRLVDQERAHQVPHHIRNAPTKLLKNLGYGREYRYEPRYAHPVWQSFFPEEIGDEMRFLSPPPDAVQSSPQPVASGSVTGSETKAMQGEADGQETVTGSKGRFLKPSDGAGPGACQRIFEIGARVVDLDLLDEWQVKKNAGQRWEGRDELEQRLLREGRPITQ